MKRVLPALLLLVSLVSVACREAPPAGHDHGGHSHSGSTDEGSVPGKPGDPADADRKVKVVALDELRYDPETVKVKSGETVTFVITNKGKADHEFVLGDEAYQAAHEVAAHDHGAMADSQNSVLLKPGETKEVTWQFTESGEVLYGCHLPGHYDGGMVGSIQVT